MKRILFLLLFLASIAAQNIRVYLNEKSIPDSLLKNLTLFTTDTLKVEYDNDTTFTSFNFILDGDIIYPDYIDYLVTSVTLNNLDTGKHILKVIAKTKENQEIESLALRFEIAKKQEAKIEEETKSNLDFLYSPYLYLIGFIVIQAIVIIVLLARKGSSKNSVLEEKEEEILRINQNLDDCYSKSKLLNDENNTLKHKVDELNSNIKELETANYELVNQKEKLQQKRLELEELQRQKDELFAMAVHDIKNPVSVIRSLIQLLESYDLSAKEQQEIMQTLIDSSENIIKLTREMTLVISKQKAENYLAIESTSLKEIVDAVVNLNATNAKKKNIKIINKSSNSIPELNIDKLKIQEVIDNFVNNAIKYGPEGTEIEIKTFFSDSKVTLEVSDNGVGLPEHDIPLLFTKGMTLSALPTGGEHSSGLGLWISKRIIEEHKGKIWAKSKQGKGSTFGFDLPR